MADQNQNPDPNQPQPTQPQPNQPQPTQPQPNQDPNQNQGSGVSVNTTNNDR